MRASRWAAWGTAAALLFGGAPAAALEFAGYFRDSIAWNTNGGAQACFRTPGMDYKLRLGNECEAYGEWEFRQSLSKTEAGFEFVVGVMINYAPEAMSNPGSGTPFGVQQNYVKMKTPWLGGAQFWAGKQFYRRENIDPLDFFYLNTSEPGVGVEDVDLGFGKLAASVFGVKGRAPGDFTQGFFRPDVRVYGIPVNPNGTLLVDANLVYYSRNESVPEGPDDAEVSFWVTIEHIQDKLLGGSNKLAVQWANGTAAQMGPGTPSFGADPLHQDNRQFRVVEQLLLQPTRRFQVMVGGVYQRKTLFAATSPDTSAKTDLTQWGVFGRPVFYLSDYFKIQGDAGYTQNKPEDQSALNLFKFTIAPTLTPPPGATGGFFVRPEIRLFWTAAFWNDAARDAVDPSTTPPTSVAPGGGLFPAETSGSTVGMSVETWF